MTDWSELKRLAIEAGVTCFSAPEAYDDDRHYTMNELTYLEFLKQSAPCHVLALIAENERLETEVITAHKFADGLQEMIRRQNKTHCRLAEEIKQLKKTARDG